MHQRFDFYRRKSTYRCQWNLLAEQTLVNFKKINSNITCGPLLRNMQYWLLMSTHHSG